jgi:hypothetical protein
MFIAMNRFRVAKGLRRLSKTYGCRVTVTSTRCRALWNSTC